VSYRIRIIVISLALGLSLGCGGDDTTGGELAGPAAAPDPDTGVRMTPEARTDAGSTRTGCIDLDGDGYGQGCEAGPDCDDGHASANTGQLEQCGDGFDNDCDDRVDEGCGCTDGESVPCYPGDEATVGVGRCRSGFRICRDGALGPCEDSRTPISELCNGTDDDCDGTTDEGVLNACGRCGDLDVESCDLRDNDCDGQVDEGVRNDCGGCGLEPDEFCDGLDNDCDGRIDEECQCLESVRESCYTGPAGTKGVASCRAGYWVCSEGRRASCIGQILPGQEQCNSVDDDCDGLVDEGQTNACGECGAAPRERCDGPVGDFGNGLDDDCDGQIDETCDCSGRLQQPCYSGLPKHLGVGTCRGGFSDCADGQLGVCQGEVLPVVEACGDGLDTDCDGTIDEGCPSANCVPSEEVCNELDDDCDGQTDEIVRGPCGCRSEQVDEVCGDGLDNDCDGRVEEICGCIKGPPQPCYGGPPATAGVGECRYGQFQCVPGQLLQQGDEAGCRDWVGPKLETCNARDDDCDGIIDENPADGNACGTCGQAPPEVCDTVDNDCDGRIDEGVSNACGQCGPLPAEECDSVDNDCDGLVDEGTVNFCGLCGQSCFELEFDEANEWERGSSVNVMPAPDNPNALTLGSAEATGDSVLWVAATNNREVIKINTRTCEVMDSFPSYGFYPSRTAVAVDGSVWVGNRAWSDADASDYTQGNAVHLDRDGSLICRARITGTSRNGVAVRAVTLDQDGNVWLGSWDRTKIYRVSGNEVVPSDAPDGFPDCRILQEVQLASPAYGAAVDSRGFLWTSGIAGSPTKIDTRDGSVVGIVPRNGKLMEGDAESFLNVSFYGMAIDKRDNVWYGVWQPGGYVGRIDGRTHELELFRHSGSGRTRGVAVDLDGNIWAAGWEDRALFKYNPDGDLLLTVPVGDSLMGVAVDSEGGIFGVSTSRAYRFNTNGVELCRTEGLPALYTYSDMTGIQLLTITLSTGRWSVRVDGGSDDVIWDMINWDGAIPNGAFVDVRVRTAPTRAGLTAAAWSGRSFESPYRIPGANLESGYTPQNRWLEAEVRLSRQSDDVLPLLQRVRVSWQRP